MVVLRMPSNPETTPVVIVNVMDQVPRKEHAPSLGSGMFKLSLDDPGDNEWSLLEGKHGGIVTLLAFPLPPRLPWEIVVSV